MTFPEWTKPGVYGAFVGAVAVSIFGFTWGGWTTAGSADEMAQSFAADKVGVRLLAALAGHSHISTTQRYIDVNSEQLSEAVELL